MNITRILTCFRSFSRALAKDRVDAKGDGGADPENPERDGRDTCQLYRYFLCFRAFHKNNTKFQRKRGDRGRLGRPLNPPLGVDGCCSSLLFSILAIFAILFWPV